MRHGLSIPKHAVTCCCAGDLGAILSEEERVHITDLHRLGTPQARYEMDGCHGTLADLTSAPWR